MVNGTRNCWNGAVFQIGVVGGLGAGKWWPMGRVTVGMVCNKLKSCVGTTFIVLFYLAGREDTATGPYAPLELN